MKLIFTHEHADFDAIASLAAAELIYPDYIAARPIHVNRNVAVFLKEYRNEFPFQLIRQLPSEKAERILLVDTHRLFSQEFVGADTEISVIDHHLPGASLSPDWDCRFEALGACTSILIRELRAREFQLRREAANLLLLGIYEDTGNLTYGSTTVEDMRAATWLVEQGADLNVLQRYLRQPLTENQLILADRCLASAETLRIAGEEIVLATADATDIHDEYSTVAHYLRDMMNPDAIFILLRTRIGLRMIGRATNDRINVGQVMKNFHGGGHARAAAGLIALDESETTDAKMAEVRERLVSILPAYVSPPLTVASIQSANPLTLQSDLSVQEASTIVERYGYEGFPVVDQDGKLVGLLNRRQLDHARAFQLNKPISEIMDIGDYSVTAGDRVETVREIMSLSGWGQIPVRDADGGKITGIVTRTDLIQALRGGLRRERRNYREKLAAALSPGARALIDAVSEIARQFRYPVYIVGGFVRDLLLGLPVKDFDIVIEGDAIAVARRLAGRYGGAIRPHPQFGTAKWEIGSLKPGAAPFSAEPSEALPGSLDLISARTEFYDYPTALPTVERSSIKLDLHRRDFTMNTLALRLDGEAFGDLLDFWGGMNDLTQRQIRTLHSLSFTDDPTRMIRAVRFEQRFAFTIEANTLERLRLSGSLLKQVSGQRIRHEFQLLFKESDPPACFARLEALGLLKNVHPDLHWTTQDTADYRRLVAFPFDSAWIEADAELPDFLASWGGLISWLGTERRTTIEALCDRFQFPARVAAAIRGLESLFSGFAAKLKSRRSEAVFFLEKVPFASLFCYDAMSDDAAIHAFIRDYLCDWRYRRPTTDGALLKRMGFAPGAWMGAVLDRLRAARIDGEIERDEEEAALRARLISELEREGALDRAERKGEPDERMAG